MAKMVNNLTSKIEASPEVFSSKEIQQDYIKLSKNMDILVKKDRAYNFLANFDNQIIIIDYNETIFKDMGLDRGNLSQSVLESLFQQSLADEMRHLTPANNSIIDTDKAGAALSAEAHDKLPTEIDANNFTDILFGKKPCVISDF
ncbi:MAG: hypothetical protein RLZZ215_1163 [Pseudomonadota bacterium]